MLPVLRRRGFALLWLGGLVSLLGDRAMLIALDYYVYSRTGSTLAAASLVAAYYAPAALLGSVAGVFADRWDRKRIMVVTNLAQAAVTSLLLLHPSERLWLAYVVAFAQTALSMFFEPAESALLPSLVEEGELIAANSLNALNNNLARLAGPPIGGVLLGVLGLGGVALVDASSFLVAAGLISLVPAPPRRPVEAEAGAPGTAQGSSWRQWLDGLALVRRDRLVASLFLVAVFTSFGGAMFDPLVAPWVLSVLHGGPEVLGWLSTVGAIGGLLGGLLLGRFGGGLRPAQLFGWGNVATGSLLLVMYTLSSLPAVLALNLLKGIPLVGSGAGLQTLLQTGVPDRYRGRVYGALGTANALVGLASLGLAGTLGEVMGIVPALGIAAGLTALAGVLGLVMLPHAEVRRERLGETGAGTPSAL